MNNGRVANIQTDLRTCDISRVFIQFNNDVFLGWPIYFVCFKMIPFCVCVCVYVCVLCVYMLYNIKTYSVAGPLTEMKYLTKH